METMAASVCVRVRCVCVLIALNYIYSYDEIVNSYFDKNYFNCSLRSIFKVSRSQDFNNK